MTKSSKDYGISSEVFNIIALLNDTIPHKNWFISGSAANTKIKDPGDVDVFFLTEQDYVVAYNVLNSMTTTCEFSVGNTLNASTFVIGNSILPIQLIKKIFGSPDEVFDSFDINVCKKAVLPDGKHVQDITADFMPQITNPGGHTFTRYFKYIDRLGLQSYRYVLGKEAIDNYIEDTTPVHYYYCTEEVSTQLNKDLFSTAKNYLELRDYLYDQTQKRAPELLI